MKNLFVKMLMKLAGGLAQPFLLAHAHNFSLVQSCRGSLSLSLQSLPPTWLFVLLSYTRKSFYAQHQRAGPPWEWREYSPVCLWRETQTEKKCERANTENRLPSFSLFFPFEENFFFPKKLLHSYLLLKGAQYVYTFAQNSK